MLPPVPIVRRSLDEYSPLVGEQEVARLRRAAQPLKDLRLLHISSTAFGTATAGTLSVLVPLMQDLGIDAHWATPRATEEYPAVARAVYEGLFSGVFAPGTFELTPDVTVVEGEVAYIAWHATGAHVEVPFASDTLIVRDGKIAIQTAAGVINPK